MIEDRFVVEQHVGTGGIGMVFRGWDLAAERPVAIKVLAGVAEPDIKRFMREAQILAGLTVPGLVRYVHHGVAFGAPYIVMEWLERETVAARLERIGFDIRDAVALVRATCRPVAELHARGLVHRDIKPANLMMGESADDVVVIDLGLARRQVVSDVNRLTETGYVLGTPNYMSPEQVRGETVDARSDVFALGCLLYECACGFQAFSGESWLAIHTKVLVATPAPLELGCPEAPRELREIVKACLSKDAEKRPAHAAALGEALDRIATHVPAGPRRRSGTSRPGTAMTAVLSDATVQMPRVGLLLLAGRLPEDFVHALPREAHVRLALLESECLVGVIENRDRRDLARALARYATELAARVPHALVVASMQAIAWEVCIDAAANRVGALARRSVLEPGGPAILVDAEIAGLVASDYELGATEDDFVELLGARMH